MSAQPAGGRTPHERSAAGRGEQNKRSPGLPRRRGRLALVAILLVGLAYATMIQSFSWNQTSHYDLIRSLDKDGTTIDAFQEKRATRCSTRATTTRHAHPGLALFSLPFYDALNLVNAQQPGQDPRLSAAMTR